MGLAGVSGPFKGAYSIAQFATPALVPGTPIGAQQMNIWSWTAPFDLEIVDVQLFAASISAGVRVNILAGGASILDDTGGTFDNTTRGSFANAQQMGVNIANAGVFFGAGSSTNATVSQKIFGTTATSQVNSVTPSAPGSVINRGKPYGAYVMAGASLSATVSTAAGPSGNVTNLIGTIVFFPRTHPVALRSGTE